MSYLRETRVTNVATSCHVYTCDLPGCDAEHVRPVSEMDPVWPIGEAWVELYVQTAGPQMHFCSRQHAADWLLTTRGTEGT